MANKSIENATKFKHLAMKIINYNIIHTEIKLILNSEECLLPSHSEYFVFAPPTFKYKDKYKSLQYEHGSRFLILTKEYA
jgi:hypothetical protein